MSCNVYTIEVFSQGMFGEDVSLPPPTVRVQENLCYLKYLFLFHIIWLHSSMIECLLGQRRYSSSIPVVSGEMSSSRTTKCVTLETFPCCAQNLSPRQASFKPVRIRLEGNSFHVNSLIYDNIVIRKPR